MGVWSADYLETLKEAATPGGGSMAGVKESGALDHSLDTPVDNR
jgi:hypothetical protein